MSMQRHAATSPSAEPGERHVPPDWLRATVSFLIFVHLFALAVAVISNWNPSTLATRLRQNVPLVKPYLQFLAMDQSYLPLYSLTFAMAEDTDMAVQVELELADGSRQTFDLPASDLRPHVRWRRDARLAETVGGLTGEAFRNMESILPQAIAAHFVAKHGAKGGTIRCTRHLLQDMQSAGTGDPYDDALFTRVYEARILLVGGNVQLMKKEAAAEVAPAPVQGSDR
ncbi:MAG: hypothetical protein ACREHD_28225 [Pirellulales bacterium]